MSYYSSYESEDRRGPGRGWIGWVLIALVAVVVVVLGQLRTSYVIERPGPVFDTLGTVSIDDETVPMVDIPLEPSFPTTGSLDMLTVTTQGNREAPATWLEVVAAWLDRSQAVVGVDDVYPSGQTQEQSIEAGAAQMEQSQQEAIAAALTVLGDEYTTSIEVSGVSDSGPAHGIIEPGDVVTKVNGEPVADVVRLREAIAENGTDKPATMTVLRDGAEQDLQVTPIEGSSADAGPVVGVEITTAYDFPYDVTIQLDNVGGPSAGHMFALAIIDKLTPGALTGGLDFAGTGTISPNGEVGPIGGIRQKMYGAARAGADYFLAPASNCNEVVGHIPEGLSVFAVRSLADSLAVVNTLSSGASTSLLPRCMAD